MHSYLEYQEIYKKSFCLPLPLQDHDASSDVICMEQGEKKIRSPRTQDEICLCDQELCV